MNATQRNLLSAALMAALLPAAAWADKGKGGGPPATPQNLPTQNLPTQGVRKETVPERATDRTMGEVQRTTNEATTDTPPPSPPTSQGSEHAAEHSSIAQRDLWTRLDTDADGRISTTEGALDAGFTASFSTYDADGDGFVTDAEYRAGAKASMKPGRD